ncbi:MAG: pyridoxamine 5-phosphate oxidase [Chloroflexaceae bacterium]|nr:pyridoxamine 5-phosphate oxidase [Chloroflexaceae bacterium]
MDEWTALIDAKPLPGDPLAANILTNPMIGLLAIEFASRRRMRLNGRVERATDGRLLVHAQQVYANCPKYIQARQIEGTPGTELNPSIVHVATGLNQSQQQWITQADTFFIASAHPAGGADASHRGGHPGFIQMLDDSALLWPDYTGNMMFNTLGNIAVHPQSGLLFLDFATGSTLQMTGQAQIIWDEALVQPYPGAERLVRYSISQVIETAQRLPWCWEFMSYSPFHPEVSERGHE